MEFIVWVSLLIVHLVKGSIIMDFLVLFLITHF
uniref:Uncharacterized protein n=1 Tax=Rhizophora mucronata TaxID=61149 RepID=A0A2P2PLL4_RHIMU